MIGKTLLSLLLISVLSTILSKGKMQQEHILENNSDTIPTKKLDTNNKAKSVINLSIYEKSYIIARNRIRKNSKILNVQDSLKELGNQLMNILKFTPLAKKTNKNHWQINIEKEMGYDKLDGMINWNSFGDTMPLFFTTNNLLYQYFKKENITSMNHLTPEKLEKIINDAMCSDWVFTNFLSYKLPSDTTTNAYAILGIGAQDYPFAPPNDLYILISKNGYTYIIEKEIRKNFLNTFPICDKLMDSAIIILSKNSNNIKLEEKQVNRIVKMYSNCYIENLKQSKQYPRIQKVIDDTYSNLQNKIR